ncbi:MAG: hypothetical protein U9Q74_12435 [Gemmatimonadota bacterium]|nr:hypothetical protein [Gemmatimonadota bacterium]
MTGTATHPSLRSRIDAALHRADAATTVVLAGHFAVYTAGGRASDFLDEPRALAAHTGMIEFARQSWLAGCDAVVSAPGARLLVLADDIQFVHPALPDRGARERLAAALVADYFRRTPTLPAFHLRELDARDVDPGRVLRRRDGAWLFSERALRAAAVERIRAAARSGRHAGLVVNDESSRIVVRDPDLGEHTLVHSGHTSCAGGYLELVLQLHARGVTRLVAVVPQRCLGPVSLGTHLARATFGAHGIQVVNIPASAGAATPP